MSLIHGYTDNGDPFIRKFTDQLLEDVRSYIVSKVVHLISPNAQVSKPFFSILQKWLFSGELQDPFSEFFVAVNPELAHLGYLRPISSNNTSLAGDGGFGGLASQDIHPNGDTSESGMRPWEGKYQFKPEMLPRFVGDTFGKKVEFWIQFIDACRL